MKNVRLFMILLIALLSISALPAAAATSTNTSPGGAAYIDNQTHSIAPYSSLWYRFDYAVTRSTILITLPNGAVSGLAFSVVTPAEAVTWWTTPPVGRGTPKGNDLTWAGNFNTLGTYYVEVVNNTTSGMSFQLTIGGTQSALDVTFTKWVTSAGTPPVLLNMMGVVGGEVGDGKYAGEVLSDHTVGNLETLVALYHINGSSHSFTAHLTITQDNVAGTALITGSVTDGWQKGAPVTGEYTVWATCPIPTPGNMYGTLCFQGTLQVLPGSEQ